MSITLDAAGYSSQMKERKNTNERPHHVLSLGAGVNSTALIHVLIDNQYPLDEVVFADTGAERPETYDYIEKVIRPFLVEKGIPFNVVRAKTQLIERCLKGHTIPDRRYRWSTRDMKIRPILRHLKTHAKEGVVQYLGIAYDEIHRMKDSRVPWLKTEWPLIYRKIDRNDCVQIIRQHGWPVPIKSGCFFCPFQSKKQWAILYHDRPELYELAIKIEENGSGFSRGFTLVEGGLRALKAKFMGDYYQTGLDDFITEECTGYCMT